MEIEDLTESEKVCARFERIDRQSWGKNAKHMPSGLGMLWCVTI
jgi:hypothetical protein